MDEASSGSRTPRARGPGESGATLTPGKDPSRGLGPHMAVLATPPTPADVIGGIASAMPAAESWNGAISQSVGYRGANGVVSPAGAPHYSSGGLLAQGGGMAGFVTPQGGFKGGQGLGGVVPGDRFLADQSSLTAQSPSLLDVSDAPPPITPIREGEGWGAGGGGASREYVAAEPSPRPPPISTPLCGRLEAPSPAAASWQPSSSWSAVSSSSSGKQQPWGICSLRWGGSPASPSRTQDDAGLPPPMGMPELLSWAASSVAAASVASGSVPSQQQPVEKLSDLTDGGVILGILSGVFPAACPRMGRSMLPEQRWAAVDECLSAVKLPPSLLDVRGVARGDGEAAFDALAALHFLEGLAGSHAFTTRLARFPREEVVRFLVSGKSVEALRAGGGLGRSRAPSSSWSCRGAGGGEGMEERMPVTISSSPAHGMPRGGGIGAVAGGGGAGGGWFVNGGRGGSSSKVGNGGVNGWAVPSPGGLGVAEEEEEEEDWEAKGERGRGWEKRDGVMGIAEEYLRLKEEAMAARDVEGEEAHSSWRSLRTQEQADERNAGVVQSMRLLSSELQRGRVDSVGGVGGIVTEESLEAWSRLRRGFWELVVEEEMAREKLRRAIEGVDATWAELGKVKEELHAEVAELRRKVCEAEAGEREWDRTRDLRTAGRAKALEERCEAAERAVEAARAEAGRLQEQIEQMQAAEMAADEQRFRGVLHRMRWAEEGQRRQAEALAQQHQLVGMQDRLISLLGYGAGARQDETGTLRNDIAECRQRVAMAAADLRAMGAAGVEDEVVVDEAVRKWRGQAQVALMCVASTNEAMRVNEQETARTKASLAGLRGELTEARASAGDMARELQGWRAASEALRDENRRLQGWAEGMEGKYRVMVRELVAQVADLRRATFSRDAWGVGGGPSAAGIPESLAEGVSRRDHGEAWRGVERGGVADPDGAWVTLDVDEASASLSLTRVRAELRDAVASLLSVAPERVGVGAAAVGSVSLHVKVARGAGGGCGMESLAGLESAWGRQWGVRCVQRASLAGGLA